MKFYVASSFRNVEAVRFVSERLKGAGHIQTYDWTKNEGISSIEELREIGMSERQAVSDADVVIVLFPAGKGSHVELGLALGLGKKVYLYSPNEDIHRMENTTTFYYLPEVQICIGSLDDLIRQVSK
ncbi:MAG: nucleoside 2-deoxyribosyltransferase [Tuberibacillus sp.]